MSGIFQRWVPDLAGLHCRRHKLLPAGLNRFTELSLELVIDEPYSVLMSQWWHISYRRANGGILVIDQPIVAY